MPETSVVQALPSSNSASAKPAGVKRKAKESSSNTPKKPRTLRLNDDTEGKAKGRGGAKSFQWLDLTTKTVNVIGSDDKKRVYCNFCGKTWGHPHQPTHI